ncbi:MAG TPA: hypothetical protein VFX07_16820, partial [Candidatus Udaeobacter sp.]|nr:hypothetical protein [Candidatus Udaeobacter sp.]
WQEVRIRREFMRFLPMHYMAFGNQSAAAAEIRTHIQLATTGLVQGSGHGRTDALDADKRP